MKYLTFIVTNTGFPSIWSFNELCKRGQCAQRLCEHIISVRRKKVYFAYSLIFKVKDLSHENVNSFIGACLDLPVVYILSAICAKGSLQVFTHTE